jgi:AraC-like DNA-binding protein
MNKYNLSRKKLDLSGVDTNRSDDWKTYYLPNYDPEWIDLLREVMCAFNTSFNDTYRRINNKEFREKMMQGGQLIQCPGLENTSALYNAGYLFYTPLCYKHRIVQSLLQNGSVNEEIIRSNIINEMKSRDRGFNDGGFDHAWLQVYDLIALMEEGNYKDGYYEICKIGKPIIRAILANKYPYPNPSRKDVAQEFGKDSDYLHLYFGKSFDDKTLS